MTIEKILGFERDGIVRIGVCDLFANSRVRLRDVITAELPIARDAGEKMALEYFNAVNSINNGEPLPNVEINPSNGYERWDLTENYKSIVDGAL